MFIIHTHVLKESLVQDEVEEADDGEESESEEDGQKYPLHTCLLFGCVVVLLLCFSNFVVCSSEALHDYRFDLSHTCICYLVGFC